MNFLKFYLAQLMASQPTDKLCMVYDPDERLVECPDVSIMNTKLDKVLDYVSWVSPVAFLYKHYRNYKKLNKFY